MVQHVRATLAEDPLKPGVNPEELRTRLGLDGVVHKRVIDELCQERWLVKSDGVLAVPGSSDRLPPGKEKLISLLLAYAESSGFVHFSADNVWRSHQGRYPKHEIQRLLNYLHSQRRLVRLGANRFLSPEALNEIKEKVRSVIRRKGSLTLEDGKEILGYGRSGTVPVLDYLDAVGFTSRQGNERILTAS